jgi:hypothetical protein
MNLQNKMTNNFWMNSKTRDKIMKEFEEYLGESNPLLELSNEEKSLYDDIYEKIKIIFDNNRDKPEQEFRELLNEELKVDFTSIEERQEKINNYIRRRFVVNNELVIDIRKQHVKEDINDLAKFLRQEEKLIGILICIRKRDYKIYMLLREDVIEGCEYHCYNGEESYSFIIHEKRCSEIKKEEKQKKEEELKEKISKESLEKVINEYKTYSEIAYKLNTDEETVKQCCVLYDLQTLITRNIKERKECPDDYIEINMDPAKKEKKLKEYLKIIKEKPVKYKGNEKGIYGIFHKITNTCVYIGSTQNIGERIERHKQLSDTEKCQWIHTYIKERGGWNEYTFGLLEEREREKGLNYIESLWCESAEPAGNRISPLKK